MSIKCLCDQSVGYTCESCEFEILEDSIKKLKAENAKLKREIEILRQYGNKDCTAMADEVLENE